jgi:hypothetical protein
MLEQLTERLMNIALRRVKSFNLVVAAAATAGLASLTLKTDDRQPLLLLAVGLIAIAMVLFFLQFAVRYAPKNPRFAERFAKIVAFVFSSVAVSFAALLAILVIWVCGQAFNWSDAPRSPEIALIDHHQLAIYASRGTWEGSSNPEIGASEPGLADVATETARLAEELELVPSNNLSWQYDLWRHRWIAYGYMISCSASQTLGDPGALDRCERGIAAGERAQAMVAERRAQRRDGAQAREDIAWIAEYHIDGMNLRDYATTSMLAYQLTKDFRYHEKACRALASIDVAYRHEDGAHTSPILRPYLAPGTDFCQDNGPATNAAPAEGNGTQTSRALAPPARSGEGALVFASAVPRS